MVVEELRNRAHGILEEIERLKAEINQLKEDTQGLPNNNNLSKDLESAVGFLGRAEIDLERGYGKIHESTKLIAQWQKEDCAFVRAVQVELMFDEQGKVTAISPDGCSFMIPEGIDPVGKYLKEIQCAGSHRVLGWYGSKAQMLNVKKISQKSAQNYDRFRAVSQLITISIHDTFVPEACQRAAESPTQK